MVYKSCNDLIQDTFLELELCKLVRVPIIVVYNSPKDYPGKYVARLWDINRKATNFVMVKDTLELIRRNIPETMQRVPRECVDDPGIVETWI